MASDRWFSILLSVTLRCWGLSCSLVPAKAFAREAIAVNPLQGPAGRIVTLTGTGWQDHGSRGLNTPIRIGSTGQVVNGHPDSNGNFSVNFTIPSSTSKGPLTISAIIGNGGSADAIYTVDDAQSPGWYGGGPSILYEDNSGLVILWERSYIYRHPGHDNLYWYAQVRFLNTSSQDVKITCPHPLNLSDFKENIRGTQGIPTNALGFVPADETFCSRNPNFTRTLKPGEFQYDWAIFHNVPSGGEVSLSWGQYGSSGWLNPWFRVYPPNISPPAECPSELTKLGTCGENTITHQKDTSSDDYVKAIEDLFGDAVTSITQACVTVECPRLIEFPTDILGKALELKSVFDLGSVIPKFKKIADMTKQLQQAKQENGPGPASPKLCEIANSLYNELNNFVNSLPPVVQEGFILGSLFFPYDAKPPCSSNLPPMQTPFPFVCITGPGGTCTLKPPSP